MGKTIINPVTEDILAEVTTLVVKVLIRILKEKGVISASDVARIIASVAEAESPLAGCAAERLRSVLQD